MHGLILKLCTDWISNDASHLFCIASQNCSLPFRSRFVASVFFKLKELKEELEKCNNEELSLLMVFKCDMALSVGQIILSMLKPKKLLWIIIHVFMVIAHGQEHEDSTSALKFVMRPQCTHVMCKNKVWILTLTFTYWRTQGLPF